MIAYFDSSALVKMYVNELGSEEVRQWIRQADVSATSAIAYAEIRAAIGRRERDGTVPPAFASEIKAALLEDWRSLFVVPVSVDIALAAGDVAEAHALRGVDAIHLATALWLAGDQDQTLSFVAWDQRLVAAAAHAGLTVMGG